MSAYYVATDSVHLTVSALSADDAARVFAEAEGISGVVDEDSLRAIVESKGGWLSKIEEAIR